MNPLQFYIGALPPSVNHYWETITLPSPKGPRPSRRISKAGLAFRAEFIRHLLDSLGLPHLLRHVVVPKAGTKREAREKLEGDMRYLLRAGGLPFFEGPAALTIGIRGALLASGKVPDIGSPLRPDLGNCEKAIGDCLQHFGVVDDDNQFDDLRIRREDPDTRRTMVRVEEIQQ